MTGANRQVRAIASLLSAITLCRLTFAAEQSTRVFILQDALNKSWCAFISESAWKAAARRTSPDFIVVADKSRGELSTIYITSNSEDARTSDEYSIGPGGSLMALKRLTDDITDRMTREQHWAIRRGRLYKTFEVWRQFDTNVRVKPAPERVSWLAEYPIIHRLQDFPFAALLSDKHAEVWQDGRRCVEGDVDVLYPAPPSAIKR